MSDADTNLIHTGDAFDVLPTLPENSVHAVVTDPPYGLAFMGRDWDDFEPKEYQKWCMEWAKEAKRVLRPGGHLLAFSGNRTHHRLFTGVEDAGFEVRDTVTWHYGSGFPKALDVSKAIDKAAGEYENREKREKYHNPDGTTRDYDGYDDSREVYADAEDSNEGRRRSIPVTDASKRWDDWKTTLKPATEYVVVARKPLAGDTVAENVQEWGTGALNIGGCRLDVSRADAEEMERANTPGSGQFNETNGMFMGRGSGEEFDTTQGRYPSNVVFHEDTAQELDARTEDTVSTGGVKSAQSGEIDERHDWKPSYSESTGGLGDSGGVSRYFYTSKASKSERTEDGSIANDHPTVKPLDLMEWLVKLVTREGQIVLDPFAGSGTTCKAAKSVGREFVGIERQPEYADVARARVGLTPNDPGNVRADDNQAGLGSFE